MNRDNGSDFGGPTVAYGHASNNKDVVDSVEDSGIGLSYSTDLSSSNPQTKIGYAKPQSDQEKHELNIALKTVSTVSSRSSYTESEPLDNVMVKLLERLGNSNHLIQRASRHVHRNNGQVTLENVLEEIQKLEKEEFMKSLSGNGNKNSTENERPAQEANAIYQPNEDEPDASTAVSATVEESGSDESVRPKIPSLPKTVRVAKTPNSKSSLTSGPVVDARVQSLLTDVKLARQALDEVKRPLMCTICETRPVAILFLICRHFVTCRECGEQVRDCPVCHHDIAGTLDVFLC